MKKWILILFFIFCCLFFFLTKAKSKQLSHIHISLKEGEIAIIFLDFSASKSLLIKTSDEYLFYLLSDEGDSSLEEKVSLFTKVPDYVFMSSSYSLSYPHKKILDEVVVLEKIQLEPNKIHYQDHTFCINQVDDCDYVYLTEEIPIKKTLDVVFYEEDLNSSYIEKFYEQWTDTYKISKQNYTVLFLQDGYEVVPIDY